MSGVWAIALKDVRLLLRDRGAAFFTFVFPVLFAVFFGMIFSQGAGSRAGVLLQVVDEDLTAASAALLSQLEADDMLRVVRVDGLEGAKEAVRAGRQTAYLRIPAGYAQQRDGLFSGERARVEIGIDPSKRMEAGLLQGLITRAMFTGLAETFTEPSKGRAPLEAARARLRAEGTPAEVRVFEPFMDSALALLDRVPQLYEEEGADEEGVRERAATWEPFEVAVEEVEARRSGPRNAFAITFPQGIVWGVMGASLGFGAGLVGERSRGTLTRLRAAPLSAGAVLGGKALGCLLATLGVVVLLCAVSAAPPVDVRPQSPALLVLAGVSVCVAFVGIMMLVAALAGSEASASGIGWGVMLVLAMIGGGMVPLAFMPGWMQSIGVVSPIRWSILALEGAIWRGWGLADMAVPCLVLLGVGAAGMAVGVGALRRRAD